MASRSGSGLSAEERESFLRKHGFALSRQGEHAIWEHTELKRLSLSASFHASAEAASRSTIGSGWTVSIPYNPGKDTWRRISKQVEQCAEKAQQLKTQSRQNQDRPDILREFRKARNSICTWKHKVRNWVKAGLDPKTASDPPISYRDFLALRAKLDR